MKKNVLLLLSLCLMILSCEKEKDPSIIKTGPSIILNQTEIAFSNGGGSQSISFESNMKWSVKLSESWCALSPSSGDASTKSVTVTISPNESYDARSCTVTIVAGSLSKTVTINQGSNSGLLVTQDKYDLSNDASTIEVEVQANVEFDVTISGNWITSSTTRGLSSSKLSFNIAKNGQYDKREGAITIKQKNGPLTSTIKVFQSQEDAIIISNKIENISNESHTLQVELKTNVDFEVIIPQEAKNWVSYTPTRALRTETLLLNITANKEYENRSTKIYVKNKATNLQDTLTINQGSNLGLLVTQDKYDLSNDASTIDVEVNANVEFDIIISDNWITKVTTRGLTSTKLQFKIAKNGSYDNREGSITIKQINGSLSSTIKVYQSQEDAIIISNKIENISNDSQTLQVELKTNVDFEMIIPQEAKNWVSYTPTRALRTETLLLNITANKEYENRSTKIYVKNKATNLQDTLTINQGSNLGLLVTQDKYDLSNDASTIEVKVKANVEFDVVISDSWITKVTTRGLTSTKLQFNIAKNGSYDNREGSITIKQKNGALSSTIKVYQSQLDAIILSNKARSLSSNSQTIEVELKTNVDFEVIIPETAKSWVSYIPTRALRTEILSLNISANEGSQARSTEIYIKNKVTRLQDTLTITQEGKEPGVYWVTKMGTLGTILNQTQKDTITTMIVKGEINKADFEVMKKRMPKLKYLDLKDVTCEGDRIPDEAFGGYNNPNRSITTIIHPSSITSIGEWAFANTSLTGSFSLPDGLKTIEKNAFSSCTGLTGSLKLPVGLIAIGAGAFTDCSGFTGHLRLPDGLTVIEAWAFGHCSGFTGSLTLPIGLKKIEPYAFVNTGFSGTLSFSDGLIEIGESAFQNCSGFTGSLNLPAGLITIKNTAFANCIGFSGSLNFSDGLTTIESNAFSGCSGFTGSLNFSDGLKIIEGYAFHGCSGFTGSLNLPASLTTIGQSAFYNCSSLTGSLSLPASLTTIESSTFSGCSGFTSSLTFPVGLTSIGDYAFQDCYGFSSSLSFPSGLNTIGIRAFMSCSGFSGSLTLPDGLKTIGEYTFYRCTGFSGSLNLPASLNKIGANAFLGCTGFTGSLNLPAELKTIESNAFVACFGFTGSLNLPDGLISIGNAAFQNCFGFTALIFGNSIVTINGSAFRDCENISGNVIFPISLNSIRNDGFKGCDKVEAFQFPHTTPPPYYTDMLPTGATVQVPASAIATYKATDGWKNYNIVANSTNGDAPNMGPKYW